MTFEVLLAEIQKLKCHEKRTQTQEYLEVVIAKESLELLRALLDAYFGSPLKPEGQIPSEEALSAAKPYGGVRKDQTLYFRHVKGFSECALLWPWGIGVLITVKLSRKGESLPPSLSWMKTLQHILLRKS